MNDLRLQLIGKLDVNATVSDVNEKLKSIENKINKLKLNIEFSKEAETRIEDLHKKLREINKFSGESKFIDTLQKQLDKAKGEAKQLNSELDALKKESGSNVQGSYIPTMNKQAVEKEVKKVKLTIDELTDKLKNEGFEYQVKFEIDEEGRKKAQQVIASIKNELGELQKVTFKPDRDGQFSNVQEIIKNTDPSILNNYSKAIKNYSDRIKEIERSGKSSEMVLVAFREELEYLKKNQDIPLIKKTQELEQSLKAMNSAFSQDEHRYNMAKSMKEAADKVDDLRNKLERTRNTYKGTIDTIKANEINESINRLGRSMPIFNSTADVEKFNTVIKTLNNNIAGLGAEATKARASSLGLFGSMAVAMQRFPVNISSGIKTL